MVGDARQFHGDAFWREHIVDIACSDGAVRHAVVLGGGFILRESNSALSLNFGHAQSSVGAGAGENHADSAVSFLLGERTHELVNGHVRLAELGPWAKRQRMVV